MANRVAPLLLLSVAAGLLSVASSGTPRPEVHAGYGCNLADPKNATSWLDFGWDYLDTLHFAGKTVFVQSDGAAPWTFPDKCNPAGNPGEAALISHAHAQGVGVLLAIKWNNSLGADTLYRFLHDPVAMEASAVNMCARAQEAHCDGLSVDFEEANVRFNATWKGLFAGYMRRISAAATKAELQLGALSTLFADLPSNTGVRDKGGNIPLERAREESGTTSGTQILKG